MGAPDVLVQLAAAGIRLTPLPDGRIWAEPRAALNDELRELIRCHKAELLRALAAEAPSDSRAQARRQRVLGLLVDNPAATYAAVTDMDADPEVVVVALAIRGRGTC